MAWWGWLLVCWGVATALATLAFTVSSCIAKRQCWTPSGRTRPQPRRRRWSLVDRLVPVRAGRRSEGAAGPASGQFSS